MRVLLIDDKRMLKNIIPDEAINQISDFEICRTYAEGYFALINHKWDVLYLDHDLGETKTGYDMMCFLEECRQFLPGKIYCVSSNPPGRKRIEQVIRKLYG